MRMISLIFKVTRIICFLPRLNKKLFDIKTGEVGVYLGKRIVVESGKIAVNMGQAEYAAQILEKFWMTRSHAVATPLVSRLSKRRGTFQSRKISVSSYRGKSSLLGMFDTP